jgi:Na+-transporting NADH:ubiquinone oxidoreductase subunit F
MISAALAVAVTTGIFIALSVLLLIAERYLVNYGSCTISLNSGSTLFDQPGGTTLLAALYDHKVYVPSACGGKGSCGFCKVAVVSGGGPVLPTELPFVSRAEQRSGVRLACQVKVKQDIEIQVPEALLAVKEFRARVAAIRQLTYDIKEINLELIEPERIGHHPGQYIQLQAPDPDGGFIHRAYSISSPVYEDTKVQLVVRLVPGGIASAYVHRLAEGDEVVFTGPYGEFRISDDPDREIVLVGGGCGMAPLKNIVYTAESRWPGRRLKLFFGARSTRDIFYLDSYKELMADHPNLQVVYALSDPLAPEEQWDGQTGFIHISVDKYLDAGSKRQAFLCGPPPMIDAVMRILKDKGMREEDIFYDKF